MRQIVIQRILCFWTKRSRGGHEARDRNAVPAALELPSGFPDLPFVLQTARYSEFDHFQQRQSTKFAERFSELGIGDIEIADDGEAISIRFVRDLCNAARPTSYPHKDLFTLQPATWGRVVYNGRYVDRCNGGWFYAQCTYNIGYLDAVSRNVFVSTLPVNQFCELAKLI